MEDEYGNIVEADGWKRARVLKGRSHVQGDHVRARRLDEVDRLAETGAAHVNDEWKDPKFDAKQDHYIGTRLDPKFIARPLQPFVVVTPAEIHKCWREGCEKDATVEITFLQNGFPGEKTYACISPSCRPVAPEAKIEDEWLHGNMQIVSTHCSCHEPGEDCDKVIKYYDGTGLSSTDFPIFGEED